MSTTDKEREAFEAWATFVSMDLRKVTKDHYMMDEANDAWLGWQARALLDKPSAGWMPIESAPQKKQIIAAYKNELGNWKKVIACFYTAGTLMTDDDYENCDDDGYAKPGWYEESESHEYILPTAGQPTHWMPLPPPPDTKESS